MKNVYLIQFGAEFGDRDNKSVFFPYSIGCIAAYAWSKPEIRERYTLKQLIARRNDFDVHALEDPFLVGFSCYVWNYSYNVEAAKQIREAFPSCRIFFGGHQITYEKALLEALPFVDYLLCYEGELPFYSLLKELDNGSLSRVPSLVYRSGGDIRLNPVRSLPADALVSPYLSGMFDALLKTDVEYIATIETVRGCPFACAYCDTALQDRTVKKIPPARTEREIDWIAAHGIEMCFCTDSNFGISERDVHIAEYLAEKKAVTGFPRKLDVALSKEKNVSAARTVEILHNAKMFHIVTLSVQSTNPDTLNAVGRKNIDFVAFERSISEYTKLGIKPFTELILGLPCETYDSFCDGFDKLICGGQKYYVEVYRCYILPNTALQRPETMRKYGIETVETLPVLHHISIDSMENISKSAKIVVSTAAMPRAEWIRANLFAIVMQAWYYMGVLNRTADYIHDTAGVSYRAFFEKLITYILQKNCRTGRVLSRFIEMFSSFADGETPLFYYDPDFGDLTWFAEEGLFLETAKVPSVFYADILEYVAQLIPSDMAKELLQYQELMLFTPKKVEEPIRFQWDFDSYFGNIKETLEKQPISVSVRQNETYHSLSEYAREVVWYKRKFGGTICNTDNSIITVQRIG